MIAITTPLAPIGLLGIVYLAVLFASLSRRLSAVTKMPDHQRWFFVAGGFVALAAMSQVIRGTANLAPHVALSVLQEPWFALASFHIPLAIGVTLCLVLVLHYWRWILREKID